MKLKHKRVLIFKKGNKYHVDDVQYPQGQCMNNLVPEQEDELTDNLICKGNIKITLEWD